MLTLLHIEMSGWVRSRSKARAFFFPSHCLGAAVVGVERTEPGAASAELRTLNKPLYNNLYHGEIFYIPTTDTGSL